MWRGRIAYLTGRSAWRVCRGTSEPHSAGKMDHARGWRYHNSATVPSQISHVFVYFGIGFLSTSVYAVSMVTTQLAGVTAPLRSAFVCLAPLMFVVLTGPARPVAAQTADYVITVTGPSSVYAGSDVYFGIHSTSSTNSTWYLDSVELSGKPMSIGALCGFSACRFAPNGKYYVWNGNGSFVLRVNIPSGFALGTQTLMLRTSSGATVKSLSLTLSIKAVPAALPLNPYLPVIPIPNIPQWESTMKTLGAKWCEIGKAYSFGYEQEVWYYDGARVYFQMADYTGDKKWEACALDIARQYRDWVLAKNGTVPGWRAFSRGLRIAWERTGDDTYRQALVMMSQNGSTIWTHLTDDQYIREVAYAINATIDAELAGEVRNPNLARLVDYLLGHYDRLFISRSYTIHQTFFDGLGAEALISYYELTKDPRIPPAIKVMLDWTWDYGWNKSTYKLVYNPDPVGPKCSSLCQSYATELINLTAPAFAWYWSVTGDPVYQQRGDELFAHSLDTDISYSGKIFSVNYRWSPAYVRWRSMKTCTYALSPSKVWVPAAGGTASFLVTTQTSCEWTAGSNDRSGCHADRE